MYLIYTDETGKSFGKNRYGFYSDGMFFIYGGLAINFNNYDIIENAFKDLCKDILGVKNIYETEIHAGLIFKRKDQFEKLSKEQSFKFFDEILQLLTKLDINLVMGIAFKDATIFGDTKNNLNRLKLVASAIYSFLNLADYFLSKKETKGIIITDEISEIRYRNLEFLKEDKNLLGRSGKGDPKIDIIMHRIFFEKLHRFNEADFSPLLDLKYRFENKLFFILDNIHFVKSHLSPLTQLTDTLLFLINVYMDVNFVSLSKNKDKILTDSYIYKQKFDLVHFIDSSINLYLSKRHLTGFMINMGNKYDLYVSDYFVASGLINSISDVNYINDILKMQAPTYMV
ncbi:DUF3800 domain-containing protein [Persephonella sp.]